MFMNGIIKVWQACIEFRWVAPVQNSILAAHETSKTWLNRFESWLHLSEISIVRFVWRRKTHCQKLILKVWLRATLYHATNKWRTRLLHLMTAAATYGLKKATIKEILWCGSFSYFLKKRRPSWWILRWWSAPSLPFLWIFWLKESDCWQIMSTQW